MMGKTILIVDDTTAIIDYIKDVLSSVGPYTVFITADNGRDAIKKAVNDKPDVIIMDTDLPQMNGNETLIRLKQKHQTKDIPVIMITTETLPKQIQIFINNKAFNYMKKPLNKQELIIKVNNAFILSKALKELKEQKKTLFYEKQKADAILKVLLPSKIINDIKKTGYSTPKRYQNVVVTFIDLVNFTKKTTTMSPHRLIKELNELYSAYDEIVSKYKCSRIKTVGDAFIITCGLPGENDNAISDAAKISLKIRNYIINRNMSNPVKWKIRIGMYYGDVIGSLVSESNYTFDIFGNTVNMAARYQTLCDPMQINIPKSMAEVLKSKYHIIERSPRKVKGQGIMPMYYLHNPLPKANIPKEEDIFVTNKPALMY